MSRCIMLASLSKIAMHYDSMSKRFRQFSQTDGTRRLGHGKENSTDAKIRPMRVGVANPKSVNMSSSEYAATETTKIRVLMKPDAPRSLCPESRDI